MIRICWALALALLAFWLATFRFVQGAPLWALVLLQPLVPLLNRAFRAASFEWRPVQSSQTSILLHT